MIRKTISFTEPNDEWIQHQLDTKKYASNSELINDLIRQARAQNAYDDFLRNKLQKAKESGLIYKSQDEILADFKNRAKSN